MMSPREMPGMEGTRFETGAAAVVASARLKAVPFPGVPVKASLRSVPLADAREYAVLAGCEIAASVPVLLAPAQRYALVAEIVSLLRQRIDELGLIVIGLSGSEFRIPVPVQLLQQQVILVHEPEWLVQRLLADGQAAVVGIWLALRSDGFMSGDNSLRIALHAPTVAIRAQFTAMLTEQGIFRRFKDIEVVNHD